MKLKCEEADSDAPRVGCGCRNCYDPNYVLDKAGLYSIMDERDRPTENITRTMIEAGVAALEEFASSSDEWALVVAVYNAMQRSRMVLEETDEGPA